MRIDALTGGIAPAAADIADGEHLHVGAAQKASRDISPGATEQMATALATDADEAHRDALAGWHGAATTERGGRHDSRERHGTGRGYALAQELTAGNPAGRRKGRHRPAMERTRCFRGKREAPQHAVEHGRVFALTPTAALFP